MRYELSNKKMIILIAALAGLPVAASGQTGSEGEDAIEEIVVTGMRASAMSMRDAKRNSGNITDSIFAEDMGKMPDSNIAEAMQRITGIAIDRVDGEGSTVTIRTGHWISSSAG